MAKFPSEEQERFIVRMPDGMRDRLKAEAERNKRSMNAEIVARLIDSFNPEGLAEIRNQLIAMGRYVQMLERANEATAESSDATTAVADMYEEQVKELQGRLDQAADAVKLVAAAIDDAAKGAGSNLKYLLESAGPFALDGIRPDPQALLAKQYEFGLSRLDELPDDERAAEHARLVSLLQGSAELMGVDWSPPKWDDDE